jgi:hypothetical protein
VAVSLTIHGGAHAESGQTAQIERVENSDAPNPDAKRLKFFAKRPKIVSDVSNASSCPAVPKS